MPKNQGAVRQRCAVAGAESRTARDMRRFGLQTPSNHEPGVPCREVKCPQWRRHEPGQWLRSKNPGVDGSRS